MDQKYAKFAKNIGQSSALQAHENAITLSGDIINQIVEKMPYLAMLKNPSKIFLDPDPEADDFQNLINSSSYPDTSLVKVSRF